MLCGSKCQAYLNIFLGFATPALQIETFDRGYRNGQLFPATRISRGFLLPVTATAVPGIFIHARLSSMTDQAKQNRRV
jgi:hypothetical protein